MSVADTLRKRRVIVFVLVLLLALLGAGIGSFVLDSDDNQPGIEEPAPNETLDLTLSTVENATLLSVSNVAPGDNGTATIRLRNDGTDPGTVRVANISLRQRENGIYGPELGADNSTARAELAQNLNVSLSLRRGDVTVPLYGTETAARPLATLPANEPSRGVILENGETVTVVFEWEIPPKTGNEIQSDSLQLNVTYELVGDASENTS